MSRELGGAWVLVAGRAAKVVRRPADGQWCLFAKGFSADISMGKLCLVRESDAAGEAVLREALPTRGDSRGRAKA